MPIVRLCVCFHDAVVHTNGVQHLVYGGQVAAGLNGLTTGVVDWFEQNGDTYVVADMTGDGKADFKLQIKGLHTLTADQFVL